MNKLIDLLAGDASTAAVISVLIKSCAILGVAGIIVLFLGKASAAARHAVWTASLLLVLLLPLGIFGIPTIDLGILPTVEETETTFAATPSEVEVGARTEPELAQGVSGHQPSTEADITAHRKPSSSIPSQEIGSFALSTPGALLGLWLIGVFLITVRIGVGIIGIAAVSRKAEVVTDTYAVSLMHRLCSELGINRYVSLRRTNRALPPMTWGAVRPVVILPNSDEVWEPDRLRVILLHELAHVKRLDWFTHLLGQAVCTLHWFNPLAWFAQGRQQIEQEMACDDHVITAGTLPSNYAMNLLEILRGIRNHAWPSYASTAMARKSTFEGRMVAILDPSRDRGQLHPVRAFFMIGLLVLFALPITALRPVPASITAELNSDASVLQAERSPTDSMPDEEAVAVDAASEEDALSDMAVENFDLQVDIQPEASAEAAADTTKLRAMIVALGDEDEEIRMMAARVLGEMENELAVDALARTLAEDPVAEVRSAAAWALGEIESERALRVLESALEDDDPGVRQQAAWGLGEMESEAAVPALTRALINDSNKEVRQYAAWALGEIESVTSTAALMQALSDDNTDVRTTAAWALGEIESIEAVPALARALQDEDVDVRRNAARALGEIESSDAVQALTAAANDPDESVRSYVIWALGEIEAPESAPTLIRFLDDESSQIRRSAIHALAEIDAMEAAPRIGELLLNDPDESVRSTAAYALGEFELETSVDVLQRAIDDESDQVKRGVARALGEIGSETAVTALIKMLESDDSEVRGRAAWGLGEIESPEAIGALLEVLDDDEQEVVKYAIWALGEIDEPDPEVEKRLLDILENHPDREIRKAAARALAEL